jgi:hypothetical protein
MPSLSELTGRTKTRSDIVSKPFKQRYLNAPSVGPAITNSAVRFTLPRANAGYLDASSLRLRAKLNVVTTDPHPRIAGHDAGVLISRIRVTSGSQLLMDQNANSLISNFANALISVSDNDYKNYERELSLYPQSENRASQVIAAMTANRTVIFRLGPVGSYLNQNSLIPLQNLTQPISIDLYLSQPSECFISTDADLTYTLTDVELNWSSLYSRSLDQYYGGRQVSVHSTDYGHRYNYISPATKSVHIQLPDQSSNCAGVISMLRNQTNNISDITREKLENAFVHGSYIEAIDFKIGTKSIYDSPLGPDVSEYYDQFHHLFPNVSTSRYFTPDGYAGGQNVVACNLSGAPSQFNGVSGNLLSGISSAKLVTDMSMQITFHDPTTGPIQVDSFLISDIVYSYMPNGMITVTH